MKGSTPGRAARARIWQARPIYSDGSSLRLKPQASGLGSARARNLEARPITTRKAIVIYFQLVHVGDRHGALLGLSIKVTSMLQKMTSSF